MSLDVTLLGKLGKAGSMLLATLRGASCQLAMPIPPKLAASATVPFGHLPESIVRFGCVLAYHESRNLAPTKRPQERGLALSLLRFVVSSCSRRGQARVASDIESFAADT